MSEGLANIAGGSIVEIALAGDTYQMSPVTLLHDSELEQHILNLKASPLEAIEKLPPLPEKPKPIIKRKDESTEAYGIRYKAWKEQKDEFDRRVAQRDALTAQAFMEATKPRVVTVHDQMHFLQTTESRFYRLWLSLKKHNPHLQSVQDVKSLCQRHEEWCLVNGVSENTFDIIDEKLKEAAMEEALKNFGGRARPALPPDTTEVNTDTAFRGAEFTQTSPVNTDGQSTTSTG